MNRITFGTVGMAAALLTMTSPGAAAIVAFTGSEHNTTSFPQPNASCGLPQLQVSFGAADNAVGTSSLGNFGTTQSHCITLPLPADYTNGLFSYAFAQGDTLMGVYFGSLTTSNVAGLFDNTQYFTVTGGTGRFLGASGAFVGLGTLDLRPGANLYSQQSLNGQLDLPAVPEPATWMLVIVGFAAVGTVLRSRRPMIAT